MSYPYQITFEWNEDDFYQDSRNIISRLPTPEVLAEKSEVALEATLHTIQDLGERVARSMDELESPPESLELEFGIRLGAESGVFTKENRNAHFVIKLIWRNTPMKTTN
jgi:Trypsin-co-occurring domain 1